MKNLVIIHNILWSHYKAAVFSALYQLCKKRGVNFKVYHIAETRKKRKSLSKPDKSIHNYPYEILFDDISYDDISTSAKFKALHKVLKKEERNSEIIVTGVQDLAIILIGFVLSNRHKFSAFYDSTFFDKNRVGYKETLKRILFNRYQYMFCYGTATKKYLQSLGIPDEKIKIRYQSTWNEVIKQECEKHDSRAFLQNDGITGRYIVYVGRVSIEKNIPFLIDSYKSVIDKHHNRTEKLHLVIVGDGPLKQELEQETANCETIHFVGRKTWQEVVPYYKYADGFMLPSMSEPWGLVVNEAMLCKCPVFVSSHCGAAFDLVENGKNGYVFSPLDVSELSEHIEKMVLGAYDVEKMGNEGFKMVENYKPETTAIQILDVFNS